MAISKMQPMRSAEIDLVDGFNQLESDVADEILARQNADTALGGRIDDEIIARQDANTALGGRIDDEIIARQDADTTLDGKINSEIRQRANADTEIMNIIGTGFSSSNTISTNIGDIQDSIGSGFSSSNTISTNIGDIKDSIGSGFSSSNTISTNIGDIKDSIGTGFSDSNTIASNIQNLQDFDNRFRIGMTQAYTIAASGTQVVSVDFNTPYESTDEILVLINPIGANESFTDLKCVLNSAGYVGFSATIENSDTVNSYTVALGFIAVKVN